MPARFCNTLESCILTQRQGMQLSCPQCGTRDVRVSHRQSLGEVLRAVVGIYPLRCRRCRARWETSAWADGAWKYARCPRCYRQDLTTWSQQYYHPPAMVTFMLTIGATPIVAPPAAAISRALRVAANAMHGARIVPTRSQQIRRPQNRHRPMQSVQGE
jgi:hypothetical protein